MFKVVFHAPTEEHLRSMRANEEARRRQRERALQEQHAGVADVAGVQPGQEARSQTVRRQGPKVGRNEPCPCGSGKKFKKCCGAAS